MFCPGAAPQSRRFARGIVRRLAVLAVLAGAAGCTTYYRFESPAADVGIISVAPLSFLVDAIWYAVLAAVGFLFPLVYRSVTQENLPKSGRVALWAMIALAGSLVFYNRTVSHFSHYWRVDDAGIREVNAFGVREIAWDDAYRTWADRQNMRKVTKEMFVRSPVFHVIGPGDQAIIVRQEEVGEGVFESFTQLALELYFRRDRLWVPDDQQEPARQPAASPPGEAEQP